MTEFDCIVVGSGINGLVCAAMLGRAGHTVAVLEREDVAGGCIRTGEITLPGFVHDTLSGFHPLFVGSAAYQTLGPQLHERGLEYGNNAFPTAVLMPDGRSLVLSRDRAANISRFDRCAPGDGARFAAAMDGVAANSSLTFGLLGNDLWTARMAGQVARSAWRMSASGLVDYIGDALSTARDWLENDFASDEARALFAPWVLHTGLGPDQAVSGYMAKVIAFSLEAAGAPVVRGGSARLVEAFVRLIEDQGGTVVCKADVEQILLAGKTATGVRLSDGREMRARRGIFCSVTPQALYERMLPAEAVPARVAESARRFRFGRAGMQIHLALDCPLPWPTPDLARTAMIHLTGGIDEVALAVTQASAGLLPGAPTIVLGQPTTNDPTRAPAGKDIAWLQLQELPRVVRGDSLGELAIPAGGAWDAALAQAYADRVLARLERFLPGTSQRILKRTVLSPTDLEGMNCNLVGGDPYSGDCALDQSFLWRPSRATRNHRTPFANLFHIGASTHPGPGLGGGSGFIAAQYM